MQATQYKSTINGKRESYVLGNYNTDKIILPYLESIYKNYILANNPYTNKSSIEKKIKVLRGITALLFKDILRVDSTKHEPLWHIIPVDCGYYNEKMFFKNYDHDGISSHIFRFIKEFGITKNNIEHLLSFLSLHNMIEIQEGKQRSYDLLDVRTQEDYNDVVNNYNGNKIVVNKDKVVFSESRIGSFRKIRLLPTKEWCSEINILKVLEDNISLRKSKIDYKNKKYSVKYIDKSRNSKGKKKKINRATLKYKDEKLTYFNHKNNKKVTVKLKDNYEFTKLDSIERDHRDLNKWLSNKSPLFKFVRSYGGDTNSYGRFYNDYCGMSKVLRKSVNKELNITEEIDIKACAINTILLGTCGKLYNNPLFDDDIYLELAYNIHSINLKTTRTKEDWLFVGIKEIELSNTNMYRPVTVNGISKLMSISFLKRYRFVGKLFVMNIFGNNNYDSGMKSIRNALIKAGVFLTNKQSHIRQFSPDKNLKKRLDADNYTDEKYKEKDIQAKKDWESLCIKNNQAGLERVYITDIDILDSFLNTFLSDYKEAIPYIFKNVYSITQNVESNVLYTLLKEAKNRDELIGNAHDCIYVRKENVTFWRNLQTEVFINESLNSANNFKKLLKEKTNFKLKANPTKFKNILDLKRLLNDIQKSFFTELDFKLKGNNSEASIKAFSYTEEGKALFSKYDSIIRSISIDYEGEKLQYSDSFLFLKSNTNQNSLSFLKKDNLIYSLSEIADFTSIKSLLHLYIKSYTSSNTTNKYLYNNNINLNSKKNIISNITIQNFFNIENYFGPKSGVFSSGFT